MTQRVGSCSLCGGDVMGFRGTWMAVVPPPPDRCSSCGATRGDDVIEMRRPSLSGASRTFSNAADGGSYWRVVGMR